ncbi:MAG: type VI secretion protein [Deltaproteobacteria bacterium]|jgi:type VI secretion system protein VasI|nr:type VI secretion protein [Deltaproteobacteria bacterium]
MMDFFGLNDDFDEGLSKSNTAIFTAVDIFQGQAGYEFIKNWAIKKDVSGEKKENNIILSKFTEINHKESGYEITQAILLIVYINNKTDLYVDFNEILENEVLSRNVNVEYKIDDKKEVVSTWLISKNLKAVFSSSPIELIKQLMPANKITFKVQKYGTDKFVETYLVLDGLSEAVKSIKKACRWS